MSTQETVDALRKKVATQKNQIDYLKKKRKEDSEDLKDLKVKYNYLELMLNKHTKDLDLLINSEKDFESRITALEWDDVNEKRPLVESWEGPDPKVIGARIADSMIGKLFEVEEGSTGLTAATICNDCIHRKDCKTRELVEISSVPGDIVHCSHREVEEK